MKKKTSFRALASASLPLMAGRTNQSIYPSPALAGAGGVINKIDDRYCFVAEPDRSAPCTAPNIHGRGDGNE